MPSLELILFVVWLLPIIVVFAIFWVKIAEKHRTLTDSSASYEDAYLSTETKGTGQAAYPYKRDLTLRSVERGHVERFARTSHPAPPSYPATLYLN